VLDPRAELFCGLELIGIRIAASAACAIAAVIFAMNVAIAMAQANA
jgi:hypothetical protein